MVKDTHTIGAFDSQLPRVRLPKLNSTKRKPAKRNGGTRSELSPQHREVGTIVPFRRPQSPASSPTSRAMSAGSQRPTRPGSALPLQPPIRRDFFLPESLHHIDFLQRHSISKFDFEHWFFNDDVLMRIVEMNPETTEIVVHNGRQSISESAIMTLSALKKLQKLSIPDCRGFTQTSIKLLVRKLPNLHYLNLSNCVMVDDAALAALATQARQLQHLNLHNCTQITDMGFKSLGERPRSFKPITELDLSGCSGLTDKGFLALLQGTRGLVKLNLSGLHALTDLGMMGFSSASGAGTNVLLRELDLSQTHIDAAGFAWIAPGVPDLQVLNLADCDRVGSQVLELVGEYVHSLTTLNLTNCAGVSDAGIAGLGPQPQLDKLILTNCAELTDRAFESLALHAPRLRYLTMAGLNRVSDGCLIALGAKTRLEYFNFGGTAGSANIGVRSFYGAPRISDVGACSYIVGGGASLRYLSFAGMNRLKDSTVLTLAKQCPNLVNLIVSGCANLTDKPFKELFKRCLDLESLNVSNCFLLTDKFTTHAARRGMEHKKLENAIGALQEQLQKLEEERKQLEAMENFTKLLRNGKAIEDTNTAIVKGERRLQAMPQVRLKHLDLSGCIKITDNGIVQLCIGAHTLETLKLNMCDALSDKAIKGIASGLGESLRSISIANVEQVTDAGVAALCDSCPNLASLKIKGVPLVTMPATAKGAEKLHFAQLNRANGFLVPTPFPETLRQLWRYEKKQAYVTACVLKIQRMVRNFIAMRKSVAYAMRLLKSKKAELAKEEQERLEREQAEARARMMVFDNAAIAIARVYRGLAGRKMFRLIRARKEAGVKILQRNLRGKWARLLLLKMKMGRRRQFIQRQLGAKQFQRAYRGYAARQALRIIIQIHRFTEKARECAVRTLQGQLRIMLARKRVRERKQDIVEAAALRHRSANKIQNMFRNHVAVSVLTNLRRLRFLLETHSALTIQRVFRGWLGRQDASREHQLLTEVALDIQRVFRGRGGRNIFRGMLAEREIIRARQNEAAIVMQSAWRSSVARYRARNRKLKAWEENRRNFAATFLQKFYRGRKAFKFMQLYKKMRVAEKMIKAMSNNRERRRNRMLQHGAACTLQTWYRSFLWQKAELARMRVVRDWAAATINGSVRAYFERVRMKQLLIEARLAANRIQGFFRVLAARKRWGELMRMARAAKLEEAKLAKLRLIRLRQERMEEEEKLALQIGAARRVQEVFKIYKMRKAHREAEEERKRIAEERRAKQEAYKNRNVFQVIKDNVEGAFAFARKIGEGLAGEKPSAEESKAIKERKKVRGKLSEANERKKKKRIAQRLALEAKLRAKAASGDETAANQLRQMKLDRYIFSVLSNQKLAFNVAGIKDIKMTVGIDEAMAFHKKQLFLKGTKRPYYRRVMGDPSLPRGTHGKKMQYCYLWYLKEPGSGDIIGSISLKRRKEDEPDKRLKFRTKKFKKKHPRAGENLINHPGTLLELETGRDPLKPIVDLKFSFDRVMESALEDKGYEIVENVDVSSLIWGPTLGKHKRCLLWKYCMKIEKTDYQKELEGAVATQDYYNQRLQRAIDFLALSEDEVDKFFECFCDADRDASGTIELDEFFDYMRIPRSDFLVSVCNYIDEDNDGTIDFSEFVSFVCNISLLGNKQLFQILFGVIDSDNSGSIHRDELPALLDVANLDRQVRKRITKQFEAACKGQSDGCLRQDQFRSIVERFPKVMQPIHMFQRSLQVSSSFMHSCTATNWIFD